MNKYTGLEIAVVGLACRFPQADSIGEYWQNLINGKNCVSEFSSADARAEGESESNLKKSEYIRSNAFITGKESFDASFFNYRPDEAKLMDPQMRLYHEVSWEALEDSGYANSRQQQRIGVFASASTNLPWQLYAAIENQQGMVDRFSANQLSDGSYLASRISYSLDLKGPVVFMQTACSSSLVVIHQACNSLLLGECSMALAGGVTVRPYSKRGYVYQPEMILSKDGKCRPFDSESSGTVGGEGAGVVVLKKLKAAIEDGDHIYAVIKGSAINNDGKDKVGFSAPSSRGQLEVLKKAQRMAGIKPQDISFVEAHGTATELGDPIEVEALNAAFAGCTRRSCFIGSVKSNIGHLDSAAGVAGFIKAVLAVNNRFLPATLHFKTPNPKIDFDGGPFHVAATPVDFKSNGSPLRAAVSSFGIGGTNAHAIIEEAPPVNETTPGRAYQLLCVSAKTATSLDAMCRRLKDHIDREANANLADIAYTLHTGRERFRYRKKLICENKQQAIEKLSADIDRTPELADIHESLQNIVFMFPGQGSQYVSMCRHLYKGEAFFRDALDECIRIARTYSRADFLSILYPAGSPDEQSINNTEVTQPVLFMIEYSLASLLIHWGVRPDYMIGHSIGEYVAACISGVFTLDEAVRIVIRRGELMSKAEKGLMLAVTLSSEEINSLLQKTEKDLDLAVINSEKSIVLSGRSESIRQFEKLLIGMGFEAKVLYTSHAFHSRLMDSVLADFESEVSTVDFKKPSIPYVSNVTGDLVTFEQISKPSYWSAQLRSTVQFAKGTDTLLALGKATLIEVGPGKTLKTFLSHGRMTAADHRVISLVRHARHQVNDEGYLIEAIGELWLNGVHLDWKKYYENEKRSKISLPTYCFDKTSYPTNFNIEDLFSNSVARIPIANSYVPTVHIPTLSRSILPNDPMQPDGESPAVLLCCDSGGFSDQLVGRMKNFAQLLVEVRIGAAFTMVNDRNFELNPLNPDDWNSLWKKLQDLNIQINQIVYGFALSGESTPVAYEQIDDVLSRGYLSLSYLARSIALSNQSQRMNISVVDNQLIQVSQSDCVHPIKAAILAPAKIIPSELANVDCKVIDIPYPFLHNGDSYNYAHKVVNEIFYKSADPVVAYRFGERWTHVFNALNGSGEISSNVKVKQSGTYIITGGLGGMGLTIGCDVARRYNANVILIHRTSFPAEHLWDDFLKANNDEFQCKTIRQLTELKLEGHNVRLMQADVANQSHVKSLFEDLAKGDIKINGLIWAAGTIDFDGIMQNRSKQTLINNLSSKINGVLLFEKYLDFTSLDFVALFGSIGNVFYQNKFGQVAYNAANEFLESYAQYQSAKSGIKCFTINWCDWTQVGMSVRTLMREQKTESVEVANQLITEGISPSEGVDIFYQCINSKAPLATIYRGDLNAAIGRHKDSFSQIRQSLSSKPSTSVTNDADKSDLITIFRKFFGNEQIRSGDNFFDLGGDSLKAMTLVAQINQVSAADISVKDIYESPTIELLTKEIQKRRSPNFKAIRPAPEMKYYPVSPAQRRLFFLQQFDKQSTTYNELKVYRVSGKLDVANFESILLKLVERHESLRTCFVFHNNEPHQIIHDRVSFSVDYLEDKHDSIDRTIDAFLRPFDLSAAPLFRVGLLSLSDKDHIIVIDVHHIVNDTISTRLFLEEFVALYNELPLAPIKLGYKDFAFWLSGDEQEAEKAKSRKFWLAELADSNLPELPIDYPRQPIRSTEGNRIHFTIQGASVKMLKAIAKSEGASLYMVILSFYSILLSKLGNQEDVTLGTVAAGRHYPEVDNILGMFANTIPIRNYPVGELTFRQYLQDVKARTLRCFEHQAFPYEELIDELGAVRDPSRNPLFDAFFSYYNFDKLDLQINGLTLEPYPFANRANAKFDLTLEASEGAENFSLTLEYSTALFSKETIERFVGYFKAIAQGFASNPDMKLADIEMVLGSERARLLDEFNNTAREYPKDKTIQELFEQQVERAPNQIALICNGTKLTYSQLNDQANKVAAALIRQGVTANCRVGVISHQSPELMAGILGILKAGGAYIPIDPDYPAERIEFILADSNAAVLLATTATSHISVKGGKSVININEVLSAPAAVFNPPRFNKPGDLLYIIYTSGSTGNPKGVMIEHHSFINLLHWYTREFGINDQDNILLIAPVSFDLAQKNLFATLIQGGVLTLIPNATSDYVTIADVIELEKVTSLNCSPSAFYPLLDVTEKADYLKLRTLRMVFLGGEPISTEKLRRWCASVNSANTEIVNTYGPTEFTDVVSSYRLSRVEIANNLPIPIGKPVDNNCILILDSSGKLSPVGVVGELCLTGIGCAKGYWNREQLTREKFVTSRVLQNHRMYKTGDLARWQPDGNVMYMGRIDNQVKIRGIRIECGEIENRLNCHPDIRESLVLAKSKGGDKYLTAYYTSAQPLSAAALRDHLSSTLPQYMVPAFYVWLDNFPLTPNGKVDRKQLPEPVMSAAENYVAPTSELEEKLALIWSEVLHLKKEDISTTANFFEIGGHSLSLLTINAKINQAFGSNISAANMFRLPTISALADLLKNGDTAVIKIEKKLEEREEALSLINQQRSL